MNLSKPFFLSLAIHIAVIAAAVGIWNGLRTPLKPETKIRIALLSPSAPTQNASHPISVPIPAITPIVPKKPLKTPLKADPIPVTTRASIIAPIPLAATTPPKAEPAPAIPTPIKPQASEPVAPKVPQPPPNVQAEYEEENLGRIRTLLAERLKYPKNALRLRQQGEVVIAFTLSPSGEVSALAITQSSDFELLDDAARTLILTAASMFPKPSKSVRITIPIDYKIR